MYVLGIFDNPSKDLNFVSDEQKHFKKVFGDLQNKENLTYEDFSSNSLEELMDLIDKRRDSLNWFHFSGHHIKDGGILVNDGSFSQLGEALMRCKKLKGVFINGCASKSTLDKLKDEVPICIGTFNPVSDKLATTFSRRFYEKMNDIKSWDDYEKIHDDFNAVIGEIKDLPDLSSEGINKNNRGGGSVKELEIQENYFISERSDKNKKLFNHKGIYVFNQFLTKNLIVCLEEKETHSRFIELHADESSNWEDSEEYLEDAQGILSDSFIWAIGEELRRLFAIAKEIKDDDVSKYIIHCGSTCRRALQLTIYLFICVLWDEKKQNPDKIQFDKKPLVKFFQAKKKIKLGELRNFLKVLIEIFESNSIEYPMEKEHLGDVRLFLDEESDFNIAIAEIEKLVDLKRVNEKYVIEDCRRAEESLTVVLTGFKYLARYDLITLKKIEYQKSRHEQATYVKDFDSLDKENEKKRYLTMDNVPDMSYTIQFYNDNRKVNLFPFMIDFNALTNNDGSQICFYEYLNDENGIIYWTLSKEKELPINYEGATLIENEEIKDKKYLKELQTTIRLDLLTTQFEEVIKTLIDIDFRFKKKSKPSFGPRK